MAWHDMTSLMGSHKICSSVSRACSAISLQNLVPVLRCLRYITLIKAAAAIPQSSLITGPRVQSSLSATSSMYISPVLRGVTTRWSVFMIYLGACLMSKSSVHGNVDRTISRFYPQTQKGADILANSSNTTVYMPDFFEPDHSFPIEKFPPGTPEQKQELQNFFATVANPSKNTQKLLSFGQALKSAGTRKVGAYGFCWGESG